MGGSSSFFFGMGARIFVMFLAKEGRPLAPSGDT
jgi:hypothetical protein